MSTTSAWRRGLRVAALVTVLLGLAACGSNKDNDARDGRPSATPCPVLPTADPSAKLPPGFPARDQVLYEPSVQGKTTIVKGLVDESSFVKVRDDYVGKLKASGWTIDGTDQESVEAEVQFSKASPLQTGTVKVQQLCTGYVTVRYKLNQ